MQIINKKLIILLSIATIIIIFAAILIPLKLYLMIFNGELSNDSTDWGNFGAYFGGVVGTLFGLIAVIFSLISIFITIRISNYIHLREIAFNEKNAEDQIKLIHKQNKPFLYIDLKNQPKMIEISLWNYGNGPLIISSLQLWHEHKKLKNNFTDFFDFIDFSFKQELKLTFNTGKQFVIAPNGCRTLLRLEELLPNSELYKKIDIVTRKKFLKTELSINYEDIFGNQVNDHGSLDFLGKDNQFSKTTDNSSFAQ